MISFDGSSDDDSTDSQDSELEHSPTNNDKSNRGTAHAPPETFKCDICLKNYANKKSLKAHKNIHSGEDFITLYNLIFVLITLSWGNEEVRRPFQCDQCGKRLSTKASMIDHKKMHLRQFAWAHNNHYWFPRFSSRSQAKIWLRHMRKAVDFRDRTSSAHEIPYR